jgi:hypothetical protein
MWVQRQRHDSFCRVQRISIECIPETMHVTTNTGERMQIGWKNTIAYKYDLNHGSQDCVYFPLPTSDPWNLFLGPDSSGEGRGSLCCKERSLTITNCTPTNSTLQIDFT